jgi:hypothetical protein
MNMFFSFFYEFIAIFFDGILLILEELQMD